MSTTGTTEAVPRSVGRVLDLLEIVLSTPSCNLTTAASRAGLTPTTALRHLRALETRGYVQRDDAGQFSAGPTIVRVAAALNDAGPLARLVSTAQPFLDDLARRTGESTYLAVSDGATATYVATSESTRAIRHVGWVGQNVSLEGTAIGAALAAPGTAAVRTGAVEPDITAISCAVPVRNDLALAISVIAPTHRLEPEHRPEVVAALSATTGGLAEALGLARGGIRERMKASAS